MKKKVKWHAKYGDKLNQYWSVGDDFASTTPKSSKSVHYKVDDHVLILLQHFLSTDTARMEIKSVPSYKKYVDKKI